MSASDLPGFIKKKKLLDDAGLSAADCRQYGNLFLEAGWQADALDFFLKGNVAAGLQQLQDLALQNGDAFLLERLLQAQGREAPELWRQVSARAAALGKLSMAQWAEERAGLNARTETVDPDLKQNSSGSTGADHADPA